MRVTSHVGAAVVAEARQLVPALQTRDVMPSRAGIRAQLVAQDGRLVEDLVAMRGIQEARLRELLGHTPVEVLVGAVLGAVVGLIPLG